ncbi:polysaccharide deacetylase family protein [bacterium SCSIO 12741]|nr:polysaccharide deacetylase family protein [bacterium SCSIO 12741]
MNRYNRFRLAFLVALAVFVYGWYALGWSLLFPLILIVFFAAVVFWGVVSIRANMFTETICKNPEAKGQISITFDDGPHPEFTPKLLDILKRENIQATFFCIGHKMESHPDLVQRLHQEGHLIGNHTYSHSKFIDLTPIKKFAAEIQKTSDLTQKLIGLKPRFFRPPYGITNPRVAGGIKRAGVLSIGWSIRSFDTVNKETDKVVRKVTRKLESGDILLFHDHLEWSTEILEKFLVEVRQTEFKIVPLDELINEKAYE